MTSPAGEKGPAPPRSRNTFTVPDASSDEEDAASQTNQPASSTDRADANPERSRNTFTVPDASSDEEDEAPLTNRPIASSISQAGPSETNQRDHLAIFFAEGEGYFVVDDLVKDYGPESYRRVRCALEGTIYKRKEMKPWKKQHPDLEIRRWRDYEWLPAIKESVCYSKYIATYYQYTNGGKLSEYVESGPHDGTLPWTLGVSENFVWKLFADLLKIVDHFHHPETGELPTAILGLMPHDILIHYPHGRANPPDFYVSDLALSQDGEYPCIATCDDGFTDLQMLRYCLHHAMAVQLGVGPSHTKYINFVKRLSQFAAGLADDPEHQNYRAEVEKGYYVGHHPAGVSFDDRHCQIFSLELCNYVDQLTNLIGDGPPATALPPAAIKVQFERERQEIRRLPHEVTEISNRRNNLPNANRPEVPSHSPLIFSDIDAARRYTPGGAGACFIIRVCPKSYKILEVESRPGTGRFISKAEFDEYWFLEKVAGRIPWTLVPEEVCHPDNLAVDKYWPALPALPPQLLGRPLGASDPRPNYVIGPMRNDWWFGPSGASSVPPAQLLDEHPAKRQRMTNPATQITSGGSSTNPLTDRLSRFVIETENPFRLEVDTLNLGPTGTSRERRVAGDDDDEEELFPNGRGPTAAEDLATYRRFRTVFWNGQTVKIMRDVIVRRGLGDERFATKKVHYVDALVRDDIARRARGEDDNFGIVRRH